MSWYLNIVVFSCQPMTQQMIADKIKEISIKLKDIGEKYKEIYQNPKSKIGIKYRFLQENIQKIYQFSPFLYNIWNNLS